MFSISTKWWSGKALLLFIVLSPLLHRPVIAQIAQTDRYEIPIGDLEKSFEIIPAGTEGLFLHRRLAGVKEDQLQLIKIDTAFRELWGGMLNIEKDYVFVARKAFKDKLFLLSRFKDFTRNDLNLTIIQGNGGYTQYTIKSFIPFAPSEFYITNKAILVGGYYNHVPIVLHFSLVTFNSKVLPGLFNETGELTQIRPYDDDTFDVLISAKNFERKRTIWIKNYDPDGTLIRNVSLHPEDNYHLIFGRSLKTDRDLQLVAGVYGNRSAEYSRGMFITSIDLSGLQSTRYYNFGDLENFFKYMKAKREQRIKKRIERRKIKGKKIRFNYRFLVHELVPYKDQYVLLGEAFYPRYLNLDRAPYAGFFNPYRNGQNLIIRNGRIFDGYYYTHAVVMGFDKNGKLLWDNSFEINDVKTFELEQFVKLEVKEDKIALLYLFDNQIRTKIIKDNQVLEGKSTDPIKTKSETDIVKKDGTSVGKLEYWYNDNLYAFGVQEIYSVVPGGQLRKKVFFINKISYK